MVNDRSAKRERPYGARIVNALPHPIHSLVSNWLERQKRNIYGGHELTPMGLGNLCVRHPETEVFKDEFSQLSESQ